MNPYEVNSPTPIKKPVNKNLKMFKNILMFTIIVIFFQGCTKIQNGIEINELTTFIEMKEISLFHGIFVWPMAKILIGTHKIVKSTLLAIFLLTVFNRTMGFLLTAKSTVEQEKMKEIQPFINQINSKYSNSKDKASMMQKNIEIQKLFEKHEVNPMGSMAAIFVSMPLFLSTYVSIKDNAYIGETTLLGVKTSLTTSEALKAEFNLKIIMFIVMLVVLQWVSLKLPTWLSGNTKNSNSQAASVQKNMEIALPVVMLLISWNISIALLVYFAFSPIFTMIQSYLIHKYIAQKKAKEKSIINKLY